MTVEEAIRARILMLSAVTAVVGTRVWLDKLPQSPIYPCARVQLIDDPASYHLRGPDGTTRARVQVDAYAKEGAGGDPYGQVTALAAAINGNGLGDSATGLSGWRGVIGSPAFEVTGCFRIDRTRRYDPEELRILTMSQDYYVWYRGA
jgi:hypothetical protein